ncbi:MAG: DUF1080 domain-containing protein [Planctomycetia bacterium]|nr:DUF1080 domain-containing protein [Planctomycetia bacterium]
MKKYLLLAVFTVFCLSLNASAMDVPDGFVPLFNGKDLSGWVGLGHFNPYQLEKMTKEKQDELFKNNQKNFEKHWRVEDNALINDGNGPYATTEKSYKNFELRLEYKTVAKADSGIYLRMCPQFQIWDTTKEGGKWNLGADKGSGALWNNKDHERFPLVYADKPFGEWNSVRIILKGNVVNAWLNDKQTIKDVVMDNFWDQSKDIPSEGRIQLQTHGGEIQWRNIFIKELDD